MIVKVCGMRNADNIHAVANLGVDMLGFIFWPRSRRYVPMTPSGMGLLPDRAEASLASAAGMGRSPRRVGVFVDDTVQNIVTRVYNYHLDYVQLHGDETVTMIRNLKATLIPDIQPEIKIIKALPVRDASDLARCGASEGFPPSRDGGHRPQLQVRDGPRREGCGPVAHVLARNGFRSRQ